MHESHKLDLSTEGSISEHIIFSSEKGWKSEASDQFEAIESVHTVPTFQGGLALPQESYYNTRICKNMLEYASWI